MRISDIIGLDVVDPNGKSLGEVHDVRLARQGEYGDEHALRIDGVVAGRGGFAVRLGYASHDLAGPWLLKVVLGRLARNVRYVRWSDLHLADDRLVASVTGDALVHPRELPR